MWILITTSFLVFLCGRIPGWGITMYKFTKLPGKLMSIDVIWQLLSQLPRHSVNKLSGIIDRLLRNT